MRGRRLEEVAYLQQVLGCVEASWATAHHTDLGGRLSGEPLIEGCG